MRVSSSATSGRQFFRGPLYNPLSPEHGEHILDAGLVVNPSGKIEACGIWEEIERTYHPQEVTVFPKHTMMLPGFIDLHVHLPQLIATGCQAPNLLTWLERYIFPSEACFANLTHAKAMSRWFFEELLKNGTTTANVFLTSHKEAAEVAFETAEEIGNRVIMGLNLMDCNAPKELLHSPEELLRDTEALYQRWHGRDEGRIQYAWVPRFALTCSKELMSGLGKLREKYPDAYLHTHLSEQPDETQLAMELFPEAIDYTDVYDRFGLLGPKTILAHGIYLRDGELKHIKRVDASLAHCPSSNFFLKSGRFRLWDIMERNIRWGLGSDVGAGPELSMFKVMKDAQYMQPDQVIPTHSLFYAATLGAAKALMMEEQIGNFVPGKEADFIVVNFQAKSNLRLEVEATMEDHLAGLIYLGDDRLIAKTFVRGKEVYSQTNTSLIQNQRGLAAAVSS